MNISKLTQAAASGLGQIIQSSQKTVGKNISTEVLQHIQNFKGTEIAADLNKIFIKNIIDAKNAVAAQIEKLRASASNIITKDFTLADGTKASFEIFEGTQMGSNPGFYALNKKQANYFTQNLVHKITMFPRLKPKF